MTRGKKTDLKELKKIIKKLPEGKIELASDMFKRLSFMAQTLDDLQKQIEEEGAIVTAVNGNGFEVTSEHPAHKAYTTLIARYNPLCKALDEIISNGTNEAKEADSLMNFLRRDEE